MSCTCSRTCLTGAVVVGLIAALTPGLWAQPLQQQQTVTPPGGTDAPRSLTEAQKTATAHRAMLGNKVSPGKRTHAPPAAPAQGGLIWFTSQADFEAFNQSEGKVLKGIEDFEESILPPNGGDLFDDPLESGVPNLPDGFPFPDGLTGLPNLIVQSNLGGGDPSDENPRGPNGLVAVSVGAEGVVSDGVVPLFSVDSLDLIFMDEKSGVGFNTITFFGTSVEVRVFSTTNVFLGMMTTPADPSGASFIGVWSPTPIGRINIFDAGGGPEGADNIQAWREGGGDSKVVIPNINEQDPGPSNQAFPFNRGNMRYQQVYAMDQFQGLAGIVTQFAYRVDESTGDPFNSGPIDTQIWLSHTEAGPNNMSNVFDDNSGPDKTLVFDGNLFLSSDGTGSFDIIVDIEDVFQYTGDRNLLIEIRVTNPASTTQFDSAGLGLGQGGTPWTDRVWALDPNANSGSQAGDDGMVTSITLAGGNPCPWDLDRTGDVGIGDLLILLAEWGAPYGIPELLDLLAAWGPCP